MRVCYRGCSGLLGTLAHQSAYAAYAQFWVCPLWACERRLAREFVEHVDQLFVTASSNSCSTVIGRLAVQTCLGGKIGTVFPVALWMASSVGRLQERTKIII